MTKEERADFEALTKEKDALAAANADLTTRLGEALAANEQLSTANADLIADNQAMKKAVEQIKAASKAAEAVTVAGFRLEAGDPYAEGTMAEYLKASGDPRKGVLPFVMPWGAPATLTSLRTYRVRASAAGDTIRTHAADEAIKKFAPAKNKP